MILRVPDYYGEFECTAGWCKDSCCIGWEISGTIPKEEADEKIRYAVCCNYSYPSE